MSQKKNAGTAGKNARQISAQMREEAARREKRFRVIAISVLTVAVVALVALAVPIIKGVIDDKNKTVRPLSELTAPAILDENGGISVGAEGVAGTTGPEGAVELATYIDYMCPACGTFEESNKAQIDALRGAGQLTLVIQPVAILNGYSQGTDYSTRAAAAAIYVAQNAPEQFLRFHESLFINQPQENTRGLTNAELGDRALTVGVPAEVADKIKDDTAQDEYGEWVDAKTEAVANDEALRSERGFSTPTLTLNGTKTDVPWNVEGGLTQAVNAAKENATPTS